MDRGKIGSFLLLLAVLIAGYFAVSLESSTTGPVSFCSPLKDGGAYCYSVAGDTFYLLSMWLIVGGVTFGWVVKKVRQSISSNGSIAEP